MRGLKEMAVCVMQEISNVKAAVVWGLRVVRRRNVRGFPPTRPLPGNQAILLLPGWDRRLRPQSHPLSHPLPDKFRVKYL